MNGESSFDWGGGVASQSVAKVKICPRQVSLLVSYVPVIEEGSAIHHATCMNPALPRYSTLPFEKAVQCSKWDSAHAPRATVVHD